MNSIQNSSSLSFYSLPAGSVCGNSPVASVDKTTADNIKITADNQPAAFPLLNADEDNQVSYFIYDDSITIKDNLSSSEMTSLKLNLQFILSTLNTQAAPVETTNSVAQQSNVYSSCDYSGSLSINPLVEISMNMSAMLLAGLITADAKLGVAGQELYESSLKSLTCGLQLSYEKATLSARQQINGGIANLASASFGLTAGLAEAGATAKTRSDTQKNGQLEVKVMEKQQADEKTLTEKLPDLNKLLNDKFPMDDEQVARLNRLKDQLGITDENRTKSGIKQYKDAVEKIFNGNDPDKLAQYVKMNSIEDIVLEDKGSVENYSKGIYHDSSFNDDDIERVKGYLRGDPDSNVSGTDLERNTVNWLLNIQDLKQLSGTDPLTGTPTAFKDVNQKIQISLKQLNNHDKLISSTQQIISTTANSLRMAVQESGNFTKTLYDSRASLTKTSSDLVLKNEDALSQADSSASQAIVKMAEQIMNSIWEMVLSNANLAAKASQPA